MGAATGGLVRLMAWLLGEGVDLVAVIERDPAALRGLAQAAERREASMPCPGADQLALGDD